MISFRREELSCAYSKKRPDSFKNQALHTFNYEIQIGTNVLWGQIKIAFVPVAGFVEVPVGIYNATTFCPFLKLKVSFGFVNRFQSVGNA
jgi:hypothetical protein